MLAITIDGKALLDSALVGLLGALALTLAFSIATLAFDRAHGGEGGASERSGSSGASSIGWWALSAVGSAACVGIIALGIWAIAQK